MSRLINEGKDRVVIAMATYNPDLDFFREQIQSIKNQTFSNWLCYISDDQSDGKIFSSMEKIVGEDPRFLLFSHEFPRGTPFNFENSLRKVPEDTGYIAFSDQDDVWEENKLENLLKYFDDPMVMVVHSDLSLVDHQGLETAPSCWQAEQRDINSKSLFDLFLRNNVTGCSMIFRRCLLDYALPFPQQPVTPNYYHDHWIALHGSLQGEIKAVPLPFVRYRQHGRNAVGAHMRKKNNIFRKIMNGRFLIEKSLIAYKQRDALFRDLTERNPNAALPLFPWRAGFFRFAMELLKLLSQKPQLGPLVVQLIIGRLLYKPFCRDKS